MRLWPVDGGPSRTLRETGTGQRGGPINCLCMYICSCFDFYERDLVDGSRLLPPVTLWPV